MCIKYALTKTSNFTSSTRNYRKERYFIIVIFNTYYNTSSHDSKRVRLTNICL